MASDIQIKISANVSSAVQGINQVNQKLDQMQKSSETVASKITRIGAVFTTFSAIAGTVAAVIGKTVDVCKDLVNAYSAQEQAEIKLQGVLAATQAAVGMSVSEMLELADSLQKVTTYSDQEIIAVEQMLAATRKISRDIMPEATAAVLDMAAATGDDAAGAAKDLAQALSDPAGELESLKEKGIQLTAAQAENIKKVQEQNGLYAAQKILLQEVQGTYGGIAQALADTDTGKLQQLQNAWTDLKEGLGETIMHSLDGLVDYTLSLVEQIEGFISDRNERVKVEDEAHGYLASGQTDLSGASDEALDYIADNGIIKGYRADIAAGSTIGENAEVKRWLDVYEAALQERTRRVFESNQAMFTEMETGWYDSPAQSFKNEIDKEKAYFRDLQRQRMQQLSEAQQTAQEIIDANSGLSMTAQIQAIDERIAAAQSSIDTLEGLGVDVNDATISILEEIIEGLEEQKDALKDVASDPIPTIVHAPSSASTWLSSNAGLSRSKELDDINSRIWSGRQELSAMEHAGQTGSEEYTYIQESIAELMDQKADLEGWGKSGKLSFEELATGIMDCVDATMSLCDALTDLFDNLADQAAEALDAVIGKWDEYFDELDRKQERQTETLGAALASGNMSYEEYIDALTSLDEKRAEKQKEAEAEEEAARDKANALGKAAFIAKQTNAVAEVAINTASAIMGAWANDPNPVIAGVMTGLISATAATQIAAIASQQYTPMATGGIVTAPTHALIGEGGSPELVLPLNEANLDRAGIGGRSEGVIYITINVGASYSKGQLAQEVFQGIEAAQRTGALPKWRYA